MDVVCGMNLMTQMRVRFLPHLTSHIHLKNAQHVFDCTGATCMEDLHQVS
jgi:hypothetical protein